MGRLLDCVSDPVVFLFQYHIGKTASHTKCLQNQFCFMVSVGLTRGRKNSDHGRHVYDHFFEGVNTAHSELLFV